MRRAPPVPAPPAPRVRPLLAAPPSVLLAPATIVPAPCCQDGAVRLVTFRVEDGPPRVGWLRPDGVAELAAPSMLAWLAGEGRRELGPVHDPAAVRLLAPVPEPPSV